jgi:hypothetical protein
MGSRSISPLGVCCACASLAMACGGVVSTEDASGTGAGGAPGTGASGAQSTSGTGASQVSSGTGTGGAAPPPADGAWELNLPASGCKLGDIYPKFGALTDMAIRQSWGSRRL